MALSDPQSVTVGTAVSAPRVNTEPTSATYMSPDGTVTLLVSHQIKNGRRRTLVRLGRKKISTDVLTDTKSEISSAVNFQIDRPNAGFTETELLELITGVSTWLSAGTNANAKKVLGLES